MTKKEANFVEPSSNLSMECCMCGDHGLSSELIQCRICLFRSQHSYCSNQYPRTESYNVCNWCLKKEGEGTKTQVPQNSSLACTTTRKVNNFEGEEQQKKKKVKISSNGYSRLSVKVERGTCEFFVNSPVKKEKPPSPDLHQSSIRNKLISRTQEETLRRTKSEDFSKTGLGRQVFRGKVRRYKLLEDVSIQ